MKRIVLFCLMILLPLAAQAQDARQIVADAINYWRGDSSRIEAQMTVHRPDWERTMSMNVWTKGGKKTVVRFTAPAKDAGNASLTLGDEMWNFSPKLSRVIRIPPSMKQQNWMGSDFSYNDLSKADDIVDQYTHVLKGTEENEGQKVYVIDSTPHESAAVVWGHEVLRIRADHIILQHDFYDQDNKLVKRLKVLEIGPLGGKLHATRMQMDKLENPGEWTQIRHLQAEFGLELPDGLFTLSSLRNPRQL